MAPRLRLPPLWTLSQRRVVLAIVIVSLLALALLYWRDRANITDPPPADGARSEELADRLDPNTADAAALSAIPTLGEKRAKEIVACRQSFLARHPGQTPFVQLDDLMKVPGIGQATVNNLEAYLIFPRPSPKPATQSLSIPR